MQPFSLIELYIQSRIPRSAWAKLLEVKPERIDRMREIARNGKMRKNGSHVATKLVEMFRRLVGKVAEGSLVWSKTDGWQNKPPRIVCPQGALYCNGVGPIGVCPKYWTDCPAHVSLETLKQCQLGKLRPPKQSAKP
jgi:hypothetical protein